MATLVIVRNAWQRNYQPNLLSQSLIHNVPKSQLSSEWRNYTSRSRALKAFQQKIPPPVISHFTLCIDFLKGCTAFVGIFKKGSSWHYDSEAGSSSTKAAAGTPPCEAGWSEQCSVSTPPSSAPPCPVRLIWARLPASWWGSGTKQVWVEGFQNVTDFGPKVRFLTGSMVHYDEQMMKIKTIYQGGRRGYNPVWLVETDW